MKPLKQVPLFTVRFEHFDPFRGSPCVSGRAECLSLGTDVGVGVGVLASARGVCRGHPSGRQTKEGGQPVTTLRWLGSWPKTSFLAKWRFCLENSKSSIARCGEC